MGRTSVGSGKNCSNPSRLLYNALLCVHQPTVFCLSAQKRYLRLSWQTRSRRKLSDAGHRSGNASCILPRPIFYWLLADPNTRVLPHLPRVSESMTPDTHSLKPCERKGINIREVCAAGMSSTAILVFITCCSYIVSPLEIYFRNEQ